MVRRLTAAWPSVRTTDRCPTSPRSGALNAALDIELAPFATPPNARGDDTRPHNRISSMSA
jgi:hypothetical protein